MRCIDLINYVTASGYRLYKNKSEMLNQEIASDNHTDPMLNDDDFPILIKALGYCDQYYIPYISSISIKECDDYPEFAKKLADQPFDKGRLKGRLAVGFSSDDDVFSPSIVAIRLTDFLDHEPLTLNNTDCKLPPELITLANKYRSNEEVMQVAKSIIDDIQAEYSASGSDIPENEKNRLVLWISFISNDEGQWSFNATHHSGDLFEMITSLHMRYLF